MYHSHVLVRGGTGCTSSGSPKIMEALKHEIKRQELEEEAAVVETGCHGLCVLGPTMIVYPDATFCSTVQVNDIPEIVSEHLLKSCVVARLLYQETVSPAGDIKVLIDTDFYKKQYRIALRNCGAINPENIEEYIGIGGHQTLGKMLTEMTPDDVTQTLLDAGLKGRGDAGFPTGFKRKLCKQSGADQKYVCCNTDEGDPGAFMDRSVLEGDPHALLEAMAIAGHAVGSNQGYVYVRVEYPITVECLRIAIQQAREVELLGKNIFGTGFDFGIDLRLGVGVFVRGKKTTLMTSIEGRRGGSRPRPPFPAQKGLLDKPSILNNVKTYANIPQIILNGPERPASTGTKRFKGIKVFVLGGKINNTGLVEALMGTTLRIAIEETGGGTPNGKKFKAAQTGGPFGGCIPAEHSDILIDYDNLVSTGSMVGPGSLVVMDEDGCMVDIAKFFLEFIVEESCGKCTACRIGTRRMVEILTKTTKGQVVMGDLDKLEEFCHYVKVNSLCGLGRTAPSPVSSTLHFFRDGYEVHIKEKRCPAGVCKALLSFNIDRDKCRGCMLCACNCPAGAIVGSVKNPHVIDQNKYIKCGACMEKCKFGAIYKK